jgi:hypothetical protein
LAHSHWSGDTQSALKFNEPYVDGELLRFGKDNRYMCSSYANIGKPPLEAFVTQLREARTEWRRRHPEA